MFNSQDDSQLNNLEEFGDGGWVFLSHENKTSIFAKEIDEQTDACSEKMLCQYHHSQIFLFPLSSYCSQPKKNYFRK